MTSVSNAHSVPIVQKLKELMKHGLVYGLTSSLQSVLGFILLPILTNYYTTEVFGVYSLLLLMSSLASAIFYLGASSALGRFYYEEDSDEYRRKVISTALIITLAGAATLILLSVLMAHYLSQWMFDTEQYATAIILSMGGAALVFLLNLITLILRYEKKSGLFSVVTISGVLINFGITYFLLTRLHYGILAPLIGLLVSSAICFFYLMTRYLKLVTFNLENRLVFHFLYFGIQISVVGMLFYVLDWVDRLIIKDLLDLSQVGIYSLGYRLGAIVNICVVMPFSLIWAPMRMQYADNANSDEFTSKIVSYYSIIGFGIVFIAILFGKELMGLFFTNIDYMNATNVFPVVMLALMIYGYQNILDYGIYLHKKVYVYGIISICAIGIKIALNYLLIPVYGYMAAAFVTLITYFFTSGMIYFFSNRLHKIHLEWNRIIWPIILISIQYYVLYMLQIQQVVLKFAILIVHIIALYRYWLTNTEKLYLKSTCVSLLKR